MLDFKHIKQENQEWLETSLSGKILLTTPQLNKGTAFTEEERQIFDLTGKLPASVETLESQTKRAYHQFCAFTTPLQKNNFLSSLHNQNEVLFYSLISHYLVEMMPLIYTPTVGQAVKEFSREFRQPRGLYIACNQVDQLDQILENRSNPEIDLIVVTDGEGVLGIGDQGLGGMSIPIAKLMVYTLCGGVDPLRTLAIHLDVGTNNPALLEDPLYLGLRQPRLHRKDYDDFIASFISAVERHFPKVFLHWEDFSRENAPVNLDKYRHRLCSFNDDIQGTGAVTLAALLAATQANNSDLTEQRIVVFGAGTAGMGITAQICAALVRQGLSLSEARRCFWLLDRQGLLLDNMADLTPAQKPFARPACEYSHLTKNRELINLLDTVKNVRPTVLIGCSAQPGAFTKELIQEMAYHVERPIILPLSNPNEYCEAEPVDIMSWTSGKALLATGSPFGCVTVDGKETRVAQCNNALVFPGIGLGIIAVKATQLTDSMLWAACEALRDCAPVLKDPAEPLLPSLGETMPIARYIAIAVAEQAYRDGVSEIADSATINERIDQILWKPRYIPYRRIIS